MGRAHSSGRERPPPRFGAGEKRAVFRITWSKPSEPLPKKNCFSQTHLCTGNTSAVPPSTLPTTFGWWVGTYCGWVRRERRSARCRRRRNSCARTVAISVPDLLKATVEREVRRPARCLFLPLSKLEEASAGSDLAPHVGRTALNLHRRRRAAAGAAHPGQRT